MNKVLGNHKKRYSGNFSLETEALGVKAKSALVSLRPSASEEIWFPTHPPQTTRSWTVCAFFARSPIRTILLNIKNRKRILMVLKTNLLLYHEFDHFFLLTAKLQVTIWQQLVLFYLFIYLFFFFFHFMLLSITHVARFRDKTIPNPSTSLKYTYNFHAVQFQPLGSILH